MDFVIPLEMHRAIAIANMHKKIWHRSRMWFGRYACGQTDRQTDRQTHTHTDKQTHSLQYIATAPASKVIITESCDVNLPQTKLKCYLSSVEIGTLKHGIDKGQRILLHVRVCTAANTQCVHNINHLDLLTFCSHCTPVADWHNGNVLLHLKSRWSRCTGSQPASKSSTRR